MQSDGAQAREKLLLVENDKRSLQTALDQTLAETSRLSRRLTESENALTAARARLEQMDISLAAAENERATLATARDEANERHQSETYALNLRLEALRSRAATAEQLLAEVRQTIVARTEEIRGLERKVVEANIARTNTEKPSSGSPRPAMRSTARAVTSNRGVPRCWIARAIWRKRSRRARPRMLTPSRRSRC